MVFFFRGLLKVVMDLGDPKIFLYRRRKSWKRSMHLWLHWRLPYTFASFELLLLPKKKKYVIYNFHNACSMMIDNEDWSNSPSVETFYGINTNFQEITHADFQEIIHARRGNNIDTRKLAPPKIWSRRARSNLIIRAPSVSQETNDLEKKDRLYHLK